MNLTETAILKQSHFVDTVAGNGLYLPAVTATREEDGLQMGVVHIGIAGTDTVNLIAVGKGSLWRGSVVRQLLQHKLVFRSGKSLMARGPTEADIQRVAHAHMGIFFRKIEKRRLLYIQIGTSRMPGGKRPSRIIVDDLNGELRIAGRQLTVTQDSTHLQVRGVQIGAQVNVRQPCRDVCMQFQHRIVILLTGSCQKARTFNLNTQFGKEKGLLQITVEQGDDQTVAASRIVVGQIRTLRRWPLDCSMNRIILRTTLLHAKEGQNKSKRKKLAKPPDVNSPAVHTACIYFYC